MLMKGETFVFIFSPLSSSLHQFKNKVNKYGRFAYRVSFGSRLASLSAPTNINEIRNSLSWLTFSIYSVKFILMLLHRSQELPKKTSNSQLFDIIFGEVSFLIL